MDNHTIVKRALFLAYKASSVVGMGFMQVRDHVLEEEVWNAVSHSENAVDADYVFGRMMKFHLQYNNHSIDGRGVPRSDYQSWCGKYPTYDELILAAMYSLEPK